jgi:hypothetical protein
VGPNGVQDASFGPMRIVLLELIAAFALAAQGPLTDERIIG